MLHLNYFSTYVRYVFTAITFHKISPKMLISVVLKSTTQTVKSITILEKSPA